MLRSPCFLRQFLFLVLSAGGMLVLAGCGGGSAQISGSSSPTSSAPVATSTAAHATGGPVSNICPLITPAQLQQITGITFNSGIVVNPGGSPAPGETKEAHCAYQQTVTQYSNIGDSALWFGTSADANAFYSGARSSFGSSGANPVDVSGLGDKAFSFRGGLFVMQGSTIFVISYVAPSTKQSDVSAETQIATIVLPQL
ncbi:MAG: hypothetical protein PVSMB4_11220 [Ktedonobacterales bacterium]